MKIKILFVLPSLRAGGAERVMSFIAANINKKEFETTLIITGNSKDQSYEIENDTNLVFLNKSGVKNAIPSLAKYIIRHKPQIVIGAIGHVNIALAILAIFFKRTKFIGRETIVRSGKVYQGSKNTIKLPFPDPRPIFLDKIICQSQDMKNDLLLNFDFPDDKLIVINNPVTEKFKLKKNSIKKGVFELITIGRLTKQKGHLRLLDVLSKVDFTFHFTILGDGPEKQNILAHAHNLNLTKNITHIPFTDKVEDYLSKSDLFLSGTYVEGFPNVYLESCAVGTPVLSFNALGGINEIIKPGINGWIAENEIDFLEKLKISEAKKWDENLVRESVLNKYSETIILKKYENLFKSLMKND